MSHTTLEIYRQRNLERMYRERGVALRIEEYQDGLRILNAYILRGDVPPYRRATVSQVASMARRSPVPLDTRHSVVYCAWRELERNVADGRPHSETCGGVPAWSMSDEGLMAQAILTVSGRRACDQFKSTYPG